MKSKVAIYESHEKTIDAIKVLNKEKFPMKQVSLIGSAEIIDDHLHVRSLDTVKNAPLLVGAGAGIITGLLSGLGVFSIPGFGFLYGAGAVVGAVAGFDFGLIAGGFVTVLAMLGIKKESVVRYKEHLKEGRFMVVVNGSLKEIEKAEHILHTEGTHLVEWGD